LPTGNALNAAKWREYNDAIAKWNACRANQGLATVTPTQPPPTPTPPPTPVPPSTSYADALIADWPQMASVKGKVTDEVIDALVEQYKTMIVPNVRSNDGVDWVELKQTIASILIASAKYNLNSSEIATVLSSSFGETRLGAFTSTLFSGLVEDISEDEANKPDAEGGYGGLGGNDQPGDGFKYRGRGLIQLTFKNNYKEIQNLVGESYGVDIVSSPDTLANHIQLAAESAIVALLNGITSTIPIVEDGINKYAYIGLREVIIRAKQRIIDPTTGEEKDVFVEEKRIPVSDFSFPYYEVEPQYQLPDGSYVGINDFKYRNPDGTMNFNMIRVLVNRGDYDGYDWYSNNASAFYSALNSVSYPK
jgi:hypothetical protein